MILSNSSSTFRPSIGSKEGNKFFSGNITGKSVNTFDFSDSVECLGTTILFVVTLQSTAGEDELEEAEEMESLSFFCCLLKENLLTKRSGLGFGDNTGGFMEDLLLTSVESKDLRISILLFDGTDELLVLIDSLLNEFCGLVPFSFFS